MLNVFAVRFACELPLTVHDWARKLPPIVGRHGRVDDCPQGGAPDTRLEMKPDSESRPDLERSAADAMELRPPQWELAVHIVEVQGPEGVIRGELALGESAADEMDSCWVRLIVGEREFMGAATDYFEALLVIRRQLEAERLLIRVNGACRGFWPSGMCRSMTLSRVVYRLHLDRDPESNDVVPTFECLPDAEPATVAEQERFRDQWLAFRTSG